MEGNREAKLEGRGGGVERENKGVFFHRCNSYLFIIHS